MASSRRGTRSVDIRGLQLLTLLVVAIVVPAASILWFMNEAVVSQHRVARSALADAYRGQLRLVRTRLQEHWQATLGELDANLHDNERVAFKRLIDRRAADSAIVFARDGSSHYPSLAQPVPGAARLAGESALARSLQETVRELVQQKRPADAVEMIARHFLAGPASRGLDPDGRLIAADEHLLLITLLRPDDTRRRDATARLTAMLNDYAGATLPSGQRLFLMEQLTSVAGVSALNFPTLPAERLALSFLEVNQPLRGTGIRPTGARNLWVASSAGGRVIALYTTETLIAAMRPLLTGDSPDVTFHISPPGSASRDEAMAMGSILPGWEASFEMTSGSSAALRQTRYLPIALVAIGAAVVAIAFAGQAARRQARLAALRTDLVSAVSHEIKTPLASMRLLVDVLLDDDHLDPGKTREYLQLMSAENARLTRLIDNFLTFSRLERQRQQFTFEAIDPAALASAAVQALPEPHRSQRPPTLEIEPDLAPVHADSDALLTVLLNLLDNAYKYAPGDGHVGVRVRRDRDHVVFAVHDDGMGIAPREQKRIFRRFYRVNEGSTGATGGSGLGLSIVEAIVRAHGGRVDVESALGQGSTFSVHVPVTTAGAPV